MREQTSLPHTYTYVGRLYNPATKQGNFDNDRSPVDMIIIHSIVGTVASATAHFNNKSVVPSAHYGVGYDGRITQWLPENVVAYHANNYPVNQRSIGIEHEDMGNAYGTRPDALYEASAHLVAEISKVYNIPLDREHVKKHKEISATECPGTLDIDRIIRRAKELLAEAEGEQLHEYKIKPSVFTNMVTKSSEYDDLWKALSLDESVKGNTGSHKLIIADINRRINEARASVPQAPVPPTPSAPTAPVTPSTPPVETSPAQPKSVWKADVLQVLKDILAGIKGSRTT